MDTREATRAGRRGLSHGSDRSLSTGPVTARREDTRRRVAVGRLGAQGATPDPLLTDGARLKPREGRPRAALPARVKVEPPHATLLR